MNATEYERVEGSAPLVEVVAVNGFRALLECGHTIASRAVPAGGRHLPAATWRRSESWWAPTPRTSRSRRRCLNCLSTPLAGPYLCSAHPECREKPPTMPRASWYQMRAECWNESAKGRPTVADVVADAIGARWR